MMAANAILVILTIIGPEQTASTVLWAARPVSMEFAKIAISATTSPLLLV